MPLNERLQGFEAIAGEISGLRLQIRHLEEQNKELKTAHEDSVRRNLEAVQIAADARTSADDAKGVALSTASKVEEQHSFIAAKLERIDEEELDTASFERQQLLVSAETLIQRHRALDTREAWLNDQRDKQQADPASAKAPPQCVIEDQRRTREAQLQRWQEEVDRLRWHQRKASSLEAEAAKVKVAFLQEQLEPTRLTRQN